MRRIDVPPVWLALALALVWGIGRLDPWGLSFGAVISGLVGAFGLGGGLILIALAVWELRRQATAVHPHAEPSRLVTSGIFKRSRNPIYLGFALILLGAMARLDAPLALPLLPIFVWWIERRFVVPEEDRLRRLFRRDWGRYKTEVRRWL